MAEVLTIEELRGRIDVIDEQLVRLLNVRVACAVEVGRLKHEAGLPIYQPDRESQVLLRVKQSATELSGPLTAEAVVRIFERVIDDYLEWLAHPTHSTDEIRAVLLDIEAANATTHGYGTHVFLRSLRDCFLHLNERPVSD